MRYPLLTAARASCREFSRRDAEPQSFGRPAGPPFLWASAPLREILAELGTVFRRAVLGWRRRSGGHFGKRPKGGRPPCNPRSSPRLPFGLHPASNLPYFCRSLLALLAALAGCAGAPDAGGFATIRVRLTSSAEACADFCADSVGAEISRDGESLPIGPGRIVACGEDIEFDHLPAGHNVVIKAWVGLGSVHLLEGQSAATVVPANALADVEIALVPVTVPHAGAVSPDPVAVGAEGAVVTLTGTGFGRGEGLSRVTLGDTVLAATWTDTAIAVTIPPGATGSALSVVSCGVAADAALPIRVAGAELGTSALTPPGCTGFDAKSAVAAAGGDVWVAAGCGAGAGSLVRFVASTCTLGAAALPLLGDPVAVDGGADGAVVIALANPTAVLTVPPGAEPHAVADLPVGQDPVDLAVTDDYIYAIFSDSGGVTTLWTLGVSADLIPNVNGDLRDAVASPGAVSLAAVRMGTATLVTYREKTHGDENLPLDGCEDPRRLAIGGSWAAVACAGTSPGVVAVPLASADRPRLIPLAAAPEAIALDPLGDVAFVWEPGAGRIEAVVLASGAPIGSWSLAPGDGPLVGMGDGRLLLGGPAEGGLTVIAPYGGALPCPAGGGM